MRSRTGRAPSSRDPRRHTERLNVPGAYYNEIDPYAAQWLRNLIAAGHIAPGDVDERDIRLVRADDLRGYTQCHFFAGIGVWSYALRQAGWSDEEEIWTGSCPCQPFSDAGAGEAFDDERDLWPDWFPLIRERRPSVVAGEQVASRLGLAWIDALHADLESEAYTVGAIDTCSAGFGSPNIRQRLYWVADSDRRDGREGSRQFSGERSEESGPPRRLGEPGGAGLEGLGRDGAAGYQPGRHGEGEAGSASAAGEPRRLADADGWIEGDGGIQRGGQHRLGAQDGGAGGMGDAARRGRGERRDEAQPRRSGHLDGADQDHRPGPLNGFWRAADWLCCTDGKWRPVESGTFPLVTGAPSRLGRLRAYGNAINAAVAAGFIRAYRDAR